MFWILIFSIINLVSLYNVPFLSSPKTQVYIHLEKFNEKYNLYHIGISFANYHKKLRYDYRAFNEDYSNLVNNINIYDMDKVFPELDNIPESVIQEYREYRELLTCDVDNIYSKDILWGTTNKTFEEIILYENTLNKRYRLGIYDCRHYVNRFTNWCLDKPTPIWTLHKLWDKY